MTPTRTTAPVTVLGTVRAMAGTVAVHGRAADGGAVVDAAVRHALDVFRVVDETCTRFDPTSPLMRVNARPGDWHAVPPVLFEAVRAAYAAYEETGGAFDPRVLTDLVRLGYDRSLPFGDGVETPPAEGGPRRAPDAWQPRFRAGRDPALHLGGAPVDLGGIGKGLAVRWASRVLPRLPGGLPRRRRG